MGVSLGCSQPQPSCRFERNQAAVLLIPKVQANAFDAFPDRQAAAIDQLFVVFQHFWQPVKRDSAVEMVHMVNANIRREPA